MIVRRAAAAQIGVDSHDFPQALASRFMLALSV